MNTTTGANEEAGDAADGTLDRAVAALRESAVPDGPSPLLRERTLAALADASRALPGAGIPGLPRRGRRAYWASAGTLGRAAAVLLLAAGAVAAYVVVAGHKPRVAAPVVPAPAVARRPAVPSDRPGGSSPDGTPVVRVADAPGSMVTGEIRFEGDAPAPQLIDFKQSPSCAQQHHGPVYDDSLLVNLDNTLQNVVVAVVAGLPQGKTYPAPTEPVYLDQKDCSYQPHVLAMMTGQKILVRNSDPVVHNTHSLSMKNPSFNIAQPEMDPGSPVPSPKVPEFFQVRCEFHPWMCSWFCAFDHPYFKVSGPNGTFTLDDLPPGHYRLRAWHEKLGVQERDVVVKRGQDETINFVFRAPPAGPAKPPAGQAAKDAGNPGNDVGEGSVWRRVSVATAE